MQLTDLSFLFDGNPNSMWIYELSTLNIVKVNKAAITKYGYSEAEFLSMRISDLRPPEEQENFYNYLNQTGINQAEFKGINNGGIWKHLDKNGKIVYAEITSHKHKVCKY